MEDDRFEFVQQGELAVARLLPRDVCPFCGGVGRREVEMGGIRRVAKCRCQRLPDRVALWNAAGVPARHASCSLQTFSVEPRTNGRAFSQTRRWLDGYRPGEPRKGLVFLGKPGRGKTHLLIAMLKVLVFKHGVSVRFVEFTHLLSRIREGIGRGDSEATALSPLIQPDVLAIDELGKGMNTVWERNVIDELVSRRYNAQRIVLGTTNFPLVREGGGRAPSNDSLAVAGAQTLAERLEERVYSRLVETVEFIEVEGQDHRAR